MNFLRTKYFGYGVAGCAILGMSLLIAAGLDGLLKKAVEVPDLPPTQSPKVEQVEGPIRDRLRERVVLSIVRHRAIDRLEREGFTLIGKDSRPMSRERARELVDRLDDETLIGCVREASPQVYGKLGDGQLLSNLMTWIADHQEEILAILKLILSILVLL